MLKIVERWSQVSLFGRGPTRNEAEVDASGNVMVAEQGTPDVNVVSPQGTGVAALNTITYALDRIHAGFSFAAFYTRETAATNGHRSALYLKTPAGTTYAYALASYASSHPADFYMCEDAVIDANVGVHTQAIINRNRNSAQTSVCLNNATTPAAGYVTTLDETAIAGGNFSTGSVIRLEPLEAGSGPRAVGGASRDTQLYILKADTVYVFLLENDGANASQHWLWVDWYEHEDT